MDETLKKLIIENDFNGTSIFLSKSKWYTCPEHMLLRYWDDFNILKYLIRNSRVNMAILCIESGFRPNRTFSDPFDSTPLHEAVILSNSDIVRLLLEKGASTIADNDDSESALTLAVKVGNVEVVDLILSKISTADNFVNREGFSHLHVACMRNRTDIVKSFIQHRFSVNEPVQEGSLFYPLYTPLHFAVYCHSVETVKLLVECGADIVAKDTRSVTPLHLAFRNHFYDIVDIILSVHCYKVVNPCDFESLTHFHIACARDNLEVVQEFVKRQVEIDHLTTYSCSLWVCNNAYSFAIANSSINVLKFFAMYHVVSIPRGDMEAMIQQAWIHGNADVLNLLMENRMYLNSPKTSVNEILFDINHECCTFGEPSYTWLHYTLEQNPEQFDLVFKNYLSDITTKDLRGKTPLHIAFEAERMDAVDKMLLQHVDIQENPADRYGLSHFHIACSRGHFPVIHSLYMNGAKINSTVALYSPFRPGYTPLHMAIEFHRESASIFLIEMGANIALKDKFGQTPFEFAICKMKKHRNIISCFKVIRELLQRNGNGYQSEFDNLGITLLHIACAMGDDKEVSNLLTPKNINQKVNSNSPNWAGYTPLHFAVHYRRSVVLKMLLDKGADVSITDAKGNVPALLTYWEFDDNDRDRRLLLCNKNFVGPAGMSIFQLACHLGEIQAVKHMLQMNVDVNEQVLMDVDIPTGWTPLHVAANFRDREIAGLLLEHGANVDVTDSILRTPLHYCEDAIIARMLLDKGADPNALDWNLENPLLAQVESFDQNTFHDVIIALLDSGLDINQETRDGYTIFTAITSTDLNNVVPFMKHIKRLDMLNMYVSKKNKEAFFDWLHILQEGFIDVAEVEKECKHELERMKNVMINGYTTLYDILLRDLSKMARYIVNDKLNLIVNAKDFKSKFPIYSYLVKLQMKKGLARKPLMKKFSSSLGILSKRGLGQFIDDSVSRYLSDDDMRNVIAATENFEEQCVMDYSFKNQKNKMQRTQ